MFKSVKWKSFWVFVAFLALAQVAWYVNGELGHADFVKQTLIGNTKMSQRITDVTIANLTKNATLLEELAKSSNLTDAERQNANQEAIMDRQKIESLRQWQSLMSDSTKAATR